MNSNDIPTPEQIRDTHRQRWDKIRLISKEYFAETNARLAELRREREQYPERTECINAEIERMRANFKKISDLIKSLGDDLGYNKP